MLYWEGTVWGKHFKYSRIRNILTFEVILIILACMMRAFFSPKLIVFFFSGFFFCFFVFVFLQRASGKCFPKQKKIISSVPLRKYFSYCDCIVSRKFWYFWKIFQSEFKFHSTKCLKSSAAKLWKKVIINSHFNGVAKFAL